MGFVASDRELLERCLERQPRGWEGFVDRFLGLVIHVTNHAAQARSVRLSAEDREDLCADVFLTFIKDDFAVLRQFRGRSSLATYLTVIARRVVVRELLNRRNYQRLLVDEAERVSATATTEIHPLSERRLEDREEVARLLEGLAGPEAEVVRLFHLEGKTYQEISSQVGMPENSVGSLLSRAREKLRRAGAEPTSP